MAQRSLSRFVRSLILSGRCFDAMLECFSTGFLLQNMMSVVVYAAVLLSTANAIEGDIQCDGEDITSMTAATDPSGLGSVRVTPTWDPSAWPTAQPTVEPTMPPSMCEEAKYQSEMAVSEGEFLWGGESLVSADCLCRLTMHRDGNLALL